MSELIVKVQRIDKITPHTNADKLEIAHIGAWTTCVKKDTFSPGNAVVFIPPDAILPKTLHEFLGITQYCGELPKNTEDAQAGKRRVRATRLRGERSFGTLMTISSVIQYMTQYRFNVCISRGITLGDDVAELLGITKYTPPEKVLNGDAEKPHPLFHKYTDIERYQNYPNLLCDGEQVVITEKAHGTNCRCGLIASENNELMWMGGSHTVNRKEFDAKGKPSLYWLPLHSDDKNGMQFRPMVEAIQKHYGAVSVIVFSEIIGPGIQDMTYNNKLEYRVFDISVNGSYMNWPDVVDWCKHYRVPVTPVLYQGPFNEAILMEYTDGPTIICNSPVCKFKGREGVVVKPLQEANTEEGMRCILKSISVDYLNRKGATDNA